MFLYLMKLNVFNFLIFYLIKLCFINNERWLIYWNIASREHKTRMCAYEWHASDTWGILGEVAYKSW